MSDCALCSIDPKSVVGRNREALVVIHDDWSADLHLMIVATRHIENFSDLDEHESESFTSLWRAAERAALELTGKERAVILKLGIAVPHLHVHIYPVAASEDRAAVMRMIEAETTSHRSAEERAALIAQLRQRLG